MDCQTIEIIFKNFFVYPKSQSYVDLILYSVYLNSLRLVVRDYFLQARHNVPSLAYTCGYFLYS